MNDRIQELLKEAVEIAKTEDAATAAIIYTLLAARCAGIQMDLANGVRPIAERQLAALKQIQQTRDN